MSATRKTYSYPTTRIPTALSADCFAQNGNITGFEALVRWHRPERGLVAAAEFIQ